jgi:hypothetical protein
LTSDNFSSSQAGNCYLALINEKEGVWGEPELVSPFYFHIYDYWNGRHQFPSDYIIHNSDDSRVLAVQYKKEYSYEYGTVAWNSVVFIRNTEDKWITQRVNPSNIDVVYEMKLSGDGCKLVWFQIANQAFRVIRNISST